jgi:glycosyltransferase involved in cell wall biosynthesis
MKPHNSAANQSKYPTLVSVIIPAYNAEGFIGDTIVSVLNQTYSNLEILVIDDGSKDMTAEIVHQYMHNDRRIKLIKQANAGVAAARNHGIKESKGEFVAPIDSDDTWEPSHIEKQVRCFLNSPQTVGLVYSWSFDIDEQSKATGSTRAAMIQGNVFKTLVCHNFLGNASASMTRRSCLEEVGSYDTTLRDRHAQGCEDWDLYLRIAEKFEFRAVPTLSVGYRKLSDSMSGDFGQMSRSHKLVMNSVRHRHPSLPRFLFRLSQSNLYLYFAHQRLWRKKYQQTLLWLKQAIMADPITCWIRPGLYQLMIQILFGHCATWKSRMYEPASTAVCLSIDPMTTCDRQVRRQLAVGNISHWIISMLCQDPLGPSQDQFGHSKGQSI